MGTSEEGISRSWVLRVHLMNGQQISTLKVDETPLDFEKLLIHPRAQVDFFPFGDIASPPPEKSGPVLQIPLSSTSKSRRVEIQITKP